MFFQKFRKREKTIIGAIEKISLPDLGIKNLSVRVDTGAALSALHAENIRYKKIDGKRWVYFDVVIGSKENFTYIPNKALVKHVKKITSSNGGVTKRPVIETRIKMARKSWKARVSLINRSDMSYRMLLGRNSLKDKFVVDISQKFVAS